MGRQIVQDYDVARPKSRSQLSLDVSFKNAPVHRRGATLKQRSEQKGGNEATRVFGRNAQIAVMSGRRPVVKGCFEAVVNVSSAVMSTAY